MNDENLNPVLPCICEHMITAHDIINMRLGYDSEANEEWQEDVQPRAICYECGPNDCYFVEMSNLEYLEFKSDKV